MTAHSTARADRRGLPHLYVREPRPIHFPVEELARLKGKQQKAAKRRR